MFVCVRVGPWLIQFFLRFIIHNGRWLQVRVLQHSQRRFNDRLLVFGVIGYTQRVPVAERDDQRARGPHFLGHFAQQLNRHRRNTLALQFRRHQAGQDTVEYPPAHRRSARPFRRDRPRRP